AEVGAVGRLVRLMTMAVGFTATSVDCGDRTAAKITQLQDLRQYPGALLFEGGEGLRQRAPPILPSTYVRIIPAKKTNCEIPPCMSHTPSWTGKRGCAT